MVQTLEDQLGPITVLNKDSSAGTIDATGTSISNIGGLLLTQLASEPGNDSIWIDNSGPTLLKFTDSAGDTITLGAGGDLATTLGLGNTTDGLDIVLTESEITTADTSGPTYCDPLILRGGSNGDADSQGGNIDGYAGSGTIGGAINFIGGDGEDGGNIGLTSGSGSYPGDINLITGPGSTSGSVNILTPIAGTGHGNFNVLLGENTLPDRYDNNLKTGTITLIASAPAGGKIIGGDGYFYAGDTNTFGVGKGGKIGIKGGDTQVGATGGGGAVDIYGGRGRGVGQGGPVYIGGGETDGNGALAGRVSLTGGNVNSGTGATGGIVSLQAGSIQSSATGDGGALYLNSGSSVSGNGGDIIMNSGTSSGGTGGTISMTTQNNAIELSGVSGFVNINEVQEGGGLNLYAGNRTAAVASSAGSVSLNAGWQNGTVDGSNAGFVSINGGSTAGSSFNADGGGVFLNAGSSSSGTSGNGGDANVNGGNSTNGLGGDSQLNAGNSTNAAGGWVNITSGTGSGGGANNGKVKVTTSAIEIANTNAVPGTNPSGGGYMYAEAGAGKWRGSSGTITTFGPADPHCPTCGRDFGHEWENVNSKEKLRLCMPCMLEKLDNAGVDTSFAYTRDLRD